MSHKFDGEEWQVRTVYNQLLTPYPDEKMARDHAEEEARITGTTILVVHMKETVIGQYHGRCTADAGELAQLKANYRKLVQAGGRMRSKLEKVCPCSAEAKKWKEAVEE